MLNCIRAIYGWLFALVVLQGQTAFGQFTDDIFHDINRTVIVRARLKTDVLLPCLSFEKDEPIKAVEFWHCGSVRRKIGGLNINGNVEEDWNRDGAYKIQKRMNDTPALLIMGARRELVDKYECTVIYGDGQILYSAMYFRLDFSFWYDQRWNSLFYGSLLASLMFCAASFVLNIIWIGCRKTMLWWINRTERMSRVRSMVEAMEKYRQRQMENLHDTYHRRVTAIRENYHQQVEQLRVSYGTQVGRFRGYGQAQMENVTQHLDNIRDNYNQQAKRFKLTRVREYGSRRTERLWENYERQLNRMRMFTLEQRLKLMRQYKVKQRYINKLLETFNDLNNPDEIQKRESEIRAALNLPIDPSTTFPHTSISRASSYYSLPEFVIEDDYALPPPSTYHGVSLKSAADLPSTSRVVHNNASGHYAAPLASAHSHPHSSNLAFVHATHEPDGLESYSFDGSAQRASGSLYGASSCDGRQRGDSESNVYNHYVTLDPRPDGGNGTRSPDIKTDGTEPSQTSLANADRDKDAGQNPMSDHNDGNDRATERGRLLDDSTR